MPTPVRTLLALLAIALTTPAIAQDTTNTAHQGFHFSVGLGVANASATCASCVTTANSGIGSTLRIGAALSPRTVLSFEADASGRRVGDTLTNFGWGLVVLQLYPQVASGFHVKGGAGWGEFNERRSITSTSTKIEASGPAYVAGLGWDIRRSRSFSWTPFVDYVTQSPDLVVINGTKTAVKSGASMLNLGVAASWR